LGGALVNGGGPTTQFLPPDSFPAEASGIISQTPASLVVHPGVPML
jgi:hypothetical protein